MGPDQDDPIWGWTAFRLARRCTRAAWPHVTRLAADRRTRSVADQLYRAVASISADLAEGYSRSSGPDRARFLEYALGSARESREWYVAGIPILGEAAVQDQVDALSRVARLIVAYIPDQRRRRIRPVEGGRRNE